MANGRLAHTSIAAGGYATVYNNSSSSPAIVNVVVGATEDATFSMRITDASSYDFTNNITVKTESYNSNDLRINASTTAVDSRLQWLATSGNNSSYSKRVSYKDEVGGTAYEANHGTNYTTTWAFTSDLAPAAMEFDVVPMDSVGDDIVRPVYSTDVTAYGGNDQWHSKRDRDYRVVTGRAGNNPDGEGWDSSNYDTSANIAYYQNCVAGDPWYYLTHSQKPFIGINDSGYTAGMVMSLTAYSSRTDTSPSFWYRTMGSSMGADPSVQRPYPRLRYSGNLIVLDSCQLGSNSTNVALKTIKEGLSGNNYADAIAYGTNLSDKARGVKFTGLNNTGGRDGGYVLYAEYHPDDELVYVAMRGNDDTPFVLKVNTQKLYEKYESDSSYNDVNNWPTFNPETYDFDFDDIGIGRLDSSDVSFPTLTNAPYSGTTTTYRTYYVGKNTWAMVGWDTEVGTRDILVSTDLKNWKTYSSQYSPNSYEVIATDDANITLKHDNTKLFYTQDNFVNLATDGILESETKAKILERSGIMMDNGDKLIVHNTGNIPISVQVMGYEGQS